MTLINKAVLTYTDLTPLMHHPKELKGPERIEIAEPTGGFHVYSVKLQNTFLIGNVIVAVWEPSIYIGFENKKA